MWRSSASPRNLERQSPRWSQGRTGISLIDPAATFRRLQATPMTGDHVLRPRAGRERELPHGLADPTPLRPASPPRLVTTVRQRSKHPVRMPSADAPLVAPGENSRSGNRTLFRPFSAQDRPQIAACCPTPDPCNAGDRLGAPADDQVFTSLDVSQQCREMGLRLTDFHAACHRSPILRRRFNRIRPSSNLCIRRSPEVYPVIARAEVDLFGQPVGPAVSTSRPPVRLGRRARRLECCFRSWCSRKARCLHSSCCRQPVARPELRAWPTVRQSQWHFVPDAGHLRAAWRTADPAVFQG